VYISERRNRKAEPGLFNAYRVISWRSTINHKGASRAELMVFWHIRSTKDEDGTYGYLGEGDIAGAVPLLIVCPTDPHTDFI
jgi:hypothetical protein